MMTCHKQKNKNDKRCGECSTCVITGTDIETLSKALSNVFKRHHQSGKKNKNRHAMED